MFVCCRHLYSLEYGRELDSHYAHDDAISSMLLTPDKTTLVTASWDSTVKVWRCQRSQPSTRYHIKAVVSRHPKCLVPKTMTRILL